MILKRIPWLIIAVMAIAIGLYPIIYLLVDMKSNGLLGSKSPELLASIIYNLAFYTHIIFGGIALLVGWAQFSKKWRFKYLKTHRNLGKVYILSVLLSGLAGLYIAFHANGGLVSKFGFGMLAFLWLLTTSMAYTSVRKKRIVTHKKWMVRSYALCFAAVTLRLLLPSLPAILQIGFDEAYVIISWLCWVPNLIVAEVLIRRKGMQVV